MSVFKGKTPIFLSLALGSLLLSGCGHISKNFVSEADMVDKAELATGVDASRLSVVPGSVKAEMDSIHFKVKSKGGQTWNCYFTTAVAISSDAVCKKVGSKGKDPVVRKQKKEADDCNALLRAAGRC